MNGKNYNIATVSSDIVATWRTLIQRIHWMSVVGAGRVKFNSRSFGSSSMALGSTVVTAVDISDGAEPETTPLRYDSPAPGTGE